MKRRFTLPLFALMLFVGPGCAGDDGLYAEQVYAAAVAAADGEEDLNGAPGQNAGPSRDDVRPDAQERALHFDCELPAVEARVHERTCPDGEGCDAQGRRAGHGGARVAEHRRGHGRRGLSFRRLLSIYDVDGDDALSDTERTELEADLAARCTNRQAQLLEDFDADDSGALDDDELGAARAARESARAAEQAARLADFDLDADGTLSHEERQAAHEARRAALIAEFDVDSSGELDAAEQAALRAHMRQVVRGEVSAA